MKVIHIRNVHEALPIAIRFLETGGTLRDSRNGPVIQYPEPVTTVYYRPEERVLFHPWRDANPFFHFYESLWMLAGREDVAPLVRYVKRMASFSDDGHKFNAAYGYRWRHAYLMDQLDLIIKRLKKDRDDRRSVLQIWGASHDLDIPTRDAACNLTATFQISTLQKLDMVVFCRSNDIIWGCYGANAVHFSFLQEYVARSIGVWMGKYSQISVNYHAYCDIFEDATNKLVLTPDPYETEIVAPYPIINTDQDVWDNDVFNFITLDGRAPERSFVDPFFNEVAIPIIRAHDLYRETPGSRRFRLAMESLKDCKATDWKLACEQWLMRRYDKEYAEQKK